MSKAKLEAAKELIREKQYSKARAILDTIDDPIARKWENKLDEIDPPLEELGVSGVRFWVMRSLSVILTLIGGLIILGVILAMLNKAELADQPAMPLLIGSAFVIVGIFLRKYS